MAACSPSASSATPSLVWFRSALSFASFIFLYSSSQSTHSNSLLPTPIANPTPSAGVTSVSCTSSPSSPKLGSPRLIGPASPAHDPVLACPSLDEPVEVFHLRILALRLARMICAYSSVFSAAPAPPAPVLAPRPPVGATEVLCAARSPRPPRCELARRMPSWAPRARGERPSERGETPRSWEDESEVSRKGSSDGEARGCAVIGW